MKNSNRIKIPLSTLSINILKIFKQVNDGSTIEVTQYGKTVIWLKPYNFDHDEKFVEEKKEGDFLEVYVKKNSAPK